MDSPQMLKECFAGIPVLGGVYTRTILRKTFSKTFTLFIASQRLHWFVSYARNELNEYGNTGSLVE